MFKLARFLIFLIIIMVALPGTAFATYYSNWGNYNVYGWHDQTSNWDVFNLSANDYSNRLVIIHDLTNDHWSRLAAQYQYLWPIQASKFLDISIVGQWASEFTAERYYYDTVANTVYQGRQYALSPNGQWGIVGNSYYEGDQLIKSYLIKSFATGKIKELVKTYLTPRYFWLTDDKLLYCAYSPQEKQNVIWIYDPESGTYAKLLSASLYDYNPNTNEILFARNEPTRTQIIRNLITGTEKPAPESEYYGFGGFGLTSAAEAADQSITLPKDLDLSSLNIITPRRAVQYEDELVTADQRIPLNFAFTRGEQEFVPIQPLLAPLGVQVDIKQLEPRNAKEYYISRGAQKFKLKEGEYINYQWRLFVTDDVLKQIGLSDFRVVAINKVNDQ